MAEAITVGMVVKAVLIVGGLGLVFGIIVAILYAMADAWKH